MQAVQGTDDVVVACTQEQRLFGDLAVEAQAKTSVIKFVNIRETGGWSSDAKNASPKIAALLAAAHLPEPEPVPTVTFKSAGRLLILGQMDQAEQAAALLADTLNVTIFTKVRATQAALKAAATPCWAVKCCVWRVGWARSSSLGKTTTPSILTFAHVATPAWPPALSKRLAWTTKLT